MSKETIKQQVIEAIEAARPRILTLGDELLHTPETAFKEIRSAAIIGSDPCDQRQGTTDFGRDL